MYPPIAIDNKAEVGSLKLTDLDGGAERDMGGTMAEETVAGAGVFGQGLRLKYINNVILFGGGRVVG